MSHPSHLSHTSHTPQIDVYKLAIIGAGSAAAYYLNTLGPAYDHSLTIVIGDTNPWHEERGHGLPTISHTARQIGMPSRNVTEHMGADQLVNRRDFAAEADTEIAKVRTHTRRGRVAAVSLPALGVYTLTLDDGSIVRASRVAYMAGSGAFRMPPMLTPPSGSGLTSSSGSSLSSLSSSSSSPSAFHRQDRVIGLNEFVRKIGADVSFRPRSIVVWGGNAAIDALAAADRHHVDVALWIYDGPPVWLSGSLFRQTAEPPPNRQVLISREERAGIQIIDSTTSSGVCFIWSKSGHTHSVTVDYVVYGLGSENQLVYPERLEPLLDRDGVFSDPSLPSHRDSTPAWLGWQNREGTLQVFGLAAENFSNSGNPRDNPRVSPVEPSVMALKKWLSGDIVTVGQLGYMRSAIRAANNYVPPTIADRVDFSHADANLLRIHLASRYPNLPEALTAQFIGMIRNVRDGVGRELPYGFTVRQQALIVRVLSLWENFMKQHAAGLDRFERNKTQMRKMIRAKQQSGKSQEATILQNILDEHLRHDQDVAAEMVEALRQELLRLAATASEVADARQRANKPAL
jgi:hypothetical protein